MWALETLQILCITSVRALAQILGRLWHCALVLVSPLSLCFDDRPHIPLYDHHTPYSVWNAYDPLWPMPSLVQSYDIVLQLMNDMQDSVSIQLLSDYGRTTERVVLLNPTETATLVLESGSSYRYAVKSRTRVANVTWVPWTWLLHIIP